MSRETINGLHEAECIRTTAFHDGPYKTIADAECATAGRGRQLATGGATDDGPAK